MRGDREHHPVSPAVARIVSTLRERIQAGMYEDQEWLPTERALADEFGTSRMLIRAASAELERLGLVVRLPNRRPTVHRNGWVPEARQGPSSRTVAVFMCPDPSWPASAMTLRGIQEALNGDWRLVLGSPIGTEWREAQASEARFLQQVHRDRDAAGIIIESLAGTHNLPLFEQLQADGVPMVFIDHLPPAGFSADYVGVDNRRGLEQVVRHLVRLGHRHIAHVSNFDDVSTVAERLNGYERGLRNAGIPLRPELIERDPGPSGGDPYGGCEELLGRLLALPDPPTAICTVNDVTAFRVMHSVRARGLRIPDDMSVMGFDGAERWMPTAPYLATVHQPFRSIGAHAVDLLLERIEAGPASPHRHVILDVTISSHQSVKRLLPS